MSLYPLLPQIFPWNHISTFWCVRNLIQQSGHIFLSGRNILKIVAIGDYNANVFREKKTATEWLRRKVFWKFPPQILMQTPPDSVPIFSGFPTLSELFQLFDPHLMQFQFTRQLTSWSWMKPNNTANSWCNCGTLRNNSLPSSIPASEIAWCPDRHVHE